MDKKTEKNVEYKATYCYQCVAGPDLLRIKVEDGVATEVGPNFEAEPDTPSLGRPCVKAYGLIQKVYNPHRILTPMKRTNPKKGRDEDPGFVPISWDEALDAISDKIREIDDKGRTDESGFPRIATSFGGGGTSTYYMGTLPALLGAIGPIDFSFGSGQGVKCFHSEHLYGEFWHRAFIVASDTPLCDYVLSFGFNIEAAGGVCGVTRHAAARDRGIKRVQIEPHLSITGGCSAEWVPIRPKTDAALMFALIHDLINKHYEKLDIPFLKSMSNSPYLVAANGFFLRDPETGKPLVFDETSQKPVPFDTEGIEPALKGTYTCSGIELGPDEDRWEHNEIEVKPSFQIMIEHLQECTPEWAEAICDVPAETIARLAKEYVEAACVGETIDIDGQTMPYRPVAVVLGKTVNNGWGGYDCCWGRTMLAMLVGALEVPGGTIGTTVRLNRPASDRNMSITVGSDGFMDYPMNPTSKDEWQGKPNARHAYRTLIPLVANSPWSQALGPTHLAWMMQNTRLENLPEPTQPDLWLIYRTNPAISFWDTAQVEKVMAKFPFTVCFAYTPDETNHFADILLPDRTDLEGLQLIRVGGTKYVEQFWDTQGFALRQPIVDAQGDTKDFTWIATEIARRAGPKFLEKYNSNINRGAAGVPLSGENYDFSLDENQTHEVEEIWEATCRAASGELTEGQDTQGLDYYKEHGYRVKPFSRIKWYLTASMMEKGLRYELPYQERLTRIGHELGNRLHENNINWWDKQLKEYEPMPTWKDLPGVWEEALSSNFKVDINDYPFWIVTTRSMQYSWGNNVGIQMINEVASNIKGHGGMIINTQSAKKLGLQDGDRVEIASPLSATSGHVVTRQGIRPDTVLLVGQFDHWKTPFAKDLDMPSMNKLTPMLMDLTDATGSSSDLTRVRVTKIEEAA